MNLTAWWPNIAKTTYSGKAAQYTVSDLTIKNNCDKCMSLIKYTNV